MDIVVCLLRQEKEGAGHVKLSWKWQYLYSKQTGELQQFWAPKEAFIDEELKWYTQFSSKGLHKVKSRSLKMDWMSFTSEDRWVD